MERGSPYQYAGGPDTLLLLQVIHCIAQPFLSVHLKIPLSRNEQRSGSSNKRAIHPFHRCGPVECSDRRYLDAPMGTMALLSTPVCPLWPFEPHSSHNNLYLHAGIDASSTPLGRHSDLRRNNNVCNCMGVGPDKFDHVARGFPVSPLISSGVAAV